MSRRPRPLGLASTARPAGSKSAAGRAPFSPPRPLAGPSLRRAPRSPARSPARPERVAHGPQLSQLAGERAARPPARRVAAAASAPTQGGGLELGPRGRDAPRSVTWRALAALGATRGPGKGREERDAWAPAVVAVVAVVVAAAAAAEDAGTAFTWLPGRGARHTHPCRWEPQSAGQGCGPGSGFRALRSA